MSEVNFVCLLVAILFMCIAVILNAVNTFNLVRRCDDMEDDIDMINYEKAYAEEWSDD